MICANQSTTIPISDFRLRAVMKILSLDPQSSKISRREQFIAITLLDQVLLKKLSNEPCNYCPAQDKLVPISVACLKLACKFQSQYNPKVKTLARLLRFQGDLEGFKTMCLTAEAEVLTLTDYTMPTQIFYTSFEALEANTNLDQKRFNYFLKIFIIGLEFSTELTQNIDFGKRIFSSQLRKQSKDQKIKQYLETIKAWNKTRCVKANQS